MASEIRDLKKENAEMKGEMSRFKKDTAERLARQFELEVSFFYHFLSKYY